jgi:hypothetical protein
MRSMGGEWFYPFRIWWCVGKLLKALRISGSTSNHSPLFAEELLGVGVRKVRPALARQADGRREAVSP